MYRCRLLHLEPIEYQRLAGVHMVTGAISTRITRSYGAELLNEPPHTVTKTGQLIFAASGNKIQSLAIFPGYAKLSTLTFTS